MTILYIRIVLCIHFTCKNVQLILEVAGTDGHAFIVVVYGLLLHLIKKSHQLAAQKYIFTQKGTVGIFLRK